MPRLFKRTILITGSTEGIGKEIALELASNSAENFVIIHGRRKEKCEETLDYLIKENRLENVGNVEYVVADFSSFYEISRMAEEVKLRFPRLNVLIACASILNPRRVESKEGIELTLQVNHLAHFYLWNTLLSILEDNVPSRIITVGSMLHGWNPSPVDWWDDIMCEKFYDKFMQYSRTKMMNHLATFYLHRLLLKHGMQFRVTANVIDVEEKLEKKRNSNFLSISDLHLNNNNNNHGCGVHTLVRLAEGKEYENVSGKYFDAHGKQIRPAAEATDERVQNRLWELSKEICGRFLKN